MAKWGEGDPRWIVEERADATNVNNWHWTEKNATGWSKDKLRSLLEGLEIADGDYKCKIKELCKLEGEASANNRKAKLIFFYEWDLKADWEGTISGTEKTYKGSVEVPNLSDENDEDDLDIQITVKSEKGDGYKLKEFMHSIGSQVIRDRLRMYMKSLKEEFTKGMILPTKGESDNTSAKPTEQGLSNKENVVVQGKSDSGAYCGSVQCGRLTDKVEFKCRAEDLYRALTELQMVRAFTRCDCTVEAEKGGKFVLFGGNVSGEFMSLEPHQQIVMKWRFGAWPSNHYSTVTLTLKQKDDETELHLAQTGVPSGDIERTKEGWKRHYWDPMKQTFGFGAQLF